LTISTFGLERGEGRGGEGRVLGEAFFGVLRVGEGIWKENRGLGGPTLFLFFLFGVGRGGFFYPEWVG